MNEFVTASESRTVTTHGIFNTNKNHLNIGVSTYKGLITLKPCEYTTRRFRIYDDEEGVKNKIINLNEYIEIVAYDVDGRIYKANKGFPVG